MGGAHLAEAGDECVNDCSCDCEQRQRECPSYGAVHRLSVSVKFRRTESHAGKFTNPTRTCIDVAVAVPVIGLVAAQRVPGFVDAALTVNVPSSVAVGVPVNLASIVPLKVSRSEERRVGKECR